MTAAKPQQADQNNETNRKPMGLWAGFRHSEKSLRKVVKVPL